MDSDLEADCKSCFGLCCTALSFERGSQFGHDKPAGQPCQFLAGDYRCTIHERREALGYEGCEAFDCMGAGQRASAIYASRNWQRDTGVARELYATFSVLMRLQEMRGALIAAADLDIGDALQDRRALLLGRIAERADSYGYDLAHNSAPLLAEAKDFLRGLASVVSA